MQITSQRPQRAICTQIAQIFDRTIALDGTFEAGEYTLRVNSFSQTFRVE